ncbi:hypothetical protein NDU88_010487 [Pleurodeles waltl]|uniref:Uncharacterized protein n=1 Tax=Pleurodeles waltl TaxID=8319 RepID=A0AAV7PYY0_PLEWA|nr:hypothetical protein NDU88_010487 [Pleurodeles waltl]
MADAYIYHLGKMDVQTEVLNILAAHVAKTDWRIGELKNLIKRAQEETMELTPRCTCSPVLEKLSLLPKVGGEVLEYLKANMTSPVKKTPNEGEGTGALHNKHDKPMSSEQEDITWGAGEELPVADFPECGKKGVQNERTPCGAPGVRSTEESGSGAPPGTCFGASPLRRPGEDGP